MLLRDRSIWPKVEPTKMLQQCSCLKQNNKSYLAYLEDGDVVAGHSIVVSWSESWWSNPYRVSEFGRGEVKIKSRGEGVGGGGVKIVSRGRGTGGSCVRPSRPGVGKL